MGLLIAAIFVGSIGVAVRAYSAIGARPQPEKVASAKIQDRLIAVVADSQGALPTPTSPGTAKPLHTSDPTASNPISDVTGGSASATSTQRTVLLQPCDAPCISNKLEFSREFDSSVAIESRCETQFSFSAH